MSHLIPSPELLSLSHYAYDPVPEAPDHIRILRLQPGEPNDPVRIVLEVVSLDAAWRTYEAISYVWGSPNTKHWIEINDRAFLVTTSLYQALQHFRSTTIVKTFWADAICIQQNDPPEKGYQVQLMARIYEGATTTRIWLGPDPHPPLAKKTFEFMKDTVRIARELVERYGSLKSVPALSDEENPVTQDPEQWELYNTFLKLPWFDRVWVIQEVGVAANAVFFWGDYDLLVSDLLNFNEFLYFSQKLFKVLPISWLLHDAYYGIYATYRNKDTWRKQLIPDIPAAVSYLSPDPNFIDVLLQGSRRRVTDTRDYIFAFLGHPLATRGGEDIVHANYTRHVDDVYFDVMARLIEWHGPQLPLAVAGGMGARQERDLSSDQASWVVRWDLGRYVATLGRPDHWYFAGGNEPPQARISSGTKTLTVSGVVFDKVVWTSDRFTPSHTTIDALIGDPSVTPALESIWAGLKDQTSRYAEKYDAFTMTTIAGRQGPLNKVEEHLEHHRKTVQAYLQYIEFSRRKVAGQSKPEDAEADEATLRSDARDFEDSLAWTSPNRRIFVTEKGFYGFGPPLLAAGDEVGVFPGVGVPFSLRAVGEGRFRLVGVSYVHGIMRGEVFDPADPLQLKSGEPYDIKLV